MHALRREKKHKPGAFQKKRAMRQRQATIYRALRDACTEAEKNGAAQVVIDHRRFHLACRIGMPTPLGHSYTSFVLLRLKRWGLVCAHVNEKDSGWVEVVWPVRLRFRGINSWAWERVAADITRVEDLRAGRDLDLWHL